MPTQVRQSYNLDLQRNLLDPDYVPAEATHVAKLQNGVQYFVKFENENESGATCWIQPSSQYSRHYWHSSLFQKDVEFVAI